MEGRNFIGQFNVDIKDIFFILKVFGWLLINLQTPDTEGILKSNFFILINSGYPPPGVL